MPLIEAQPDALAKVYAQSLFELAKDAGGRDNAEEIQGELEAVLELARADKAFGEFLASRVLAAASRDKTLAEIFEAKASPITVNFLRLLNRKGRLGHLPAIAAAYEQLVLDAFGRVEVDVTTAETLEGDSLEAVKGKIAAKLGKSAQDVILRAHTEPAMLGGIKIRIGDRLIDDSIATQLRRLGNRLNTDAAASLRARASDIIETSSGQ